MTAHHNPKARPNRRTLLAALARDQSGNALAIVAAAIVPLLAMVGGGIDMGRSYLAESRLQQACDAGVLAARKKLGSTIAVDGLVPAAVATTGNKFFDINYRDGSYGTSSRSFTMTLQPDYSISGDARVDVPTTVMQLFAFNKIAVHVDCEARLNFSNTDVMMVLDTTGSMRHTNPGDTKPRLDVLKDVVNNFHAQLEGSKGPGIRIRYGFVPYALNANVGALLQDAWVISNWTYQSREVASTSTSTYDYTYNDNWQYVSGSYSSITELTYAATWHAPANKSSSGWYSCDTPAPAGSYVPSSVILSEVSVPYVGPPSGTKRTRRIRLTENGLNYWVELDGSTCKVQRETYLASVYDYDEITVPANGTNSNWRYAPISRSTANWRTELNGCIEERGTYEITDYDNVDFSRALDLDLDTVPTGGNPAMQWRPAYPDIIWERELDWYGDGSFSVPAVITSDEWLFHPANQALLVACPAPARKLAEMDYRRSPPFSPRLRQAAAPIMISA